MPRKDFTSFQEGILRYQNALAGIPDRIPICAQLHELAMKESGAGAKEFYTNAELLATATLATHEKYGIDVPLVLGVGAAFLATAPPAEVAARVKTYIEAAGHKGRLMLYLCNLGATTPPQNVTAAVDVVHQYGDILPI